MINDLEICLRLAVAFVLGGIIGYERESRSKSAGLRTHILVSIGSCLIMVLSINIYATVQGLTNADPTRLAAQVVSGIGFLGAGAILKEGPMVKGLTTAASIWVVSGVGLAAGSGQLVGALFVTCLSWATLTLVSRFEKMFLPGFKGYFTITLVDKPGQIGRVCSYMGNCGISIRDIRIEEHIDEYIVVGLLLRFPDVSRVDELTSGLLQMDGVTQVKRE